MEENILHFSHHTKKKKVMEFWWNYGEVSKAGDVEEIKEMTVLIKDHDYTSY